MAGNDAGGISTFSVAGAEFGYTTLWRVPLMTLVLALVQGRSPAAWGRSRAKASPRSSGRSPGSAGPCSPWRRCSSPNMATSVSEFAGIAAATEIMGISRYVAVPVAALVVWLLVVRGSYRSVEKVLLALSAVFVTYIVAMFLAEPDWGEVVTATVVPQLTADRGYITLMIAMNRHHHRTVDAILSAGECGGQGPHDQRPRNAASRCHSRDRRRRPHQLGHHRHNRHRSLPCRREGGRRCERSARLAARGRGVRDSAFRSYGWRRLAPRSMRVPLTAAYAICEAFGWERGLDRSWSEAPAFNAIYTSVIVFGAAFILIPGLNLISVMVFSQVVGGVLLPFLLVFMIRIANDRRLMGRYVNGPVYNTVSWATVIVVVGLTVALIRDDAVGLGVSMGARNKHHIRQMARAARKAIPAEERVGLSSAACARLLAVEELVLGTHASRLHAHGRGARLPRGGRSIPGARRRDRPAKDQCAGRTRIACVDAGPDTGRRSARCSGTTSRRAARQARCCRCRHRPRCRVRS